MSEILLIGGKSDGHRVRDPGRTPFKMFNNDDYFTLSAVDADHSWSPLHNMETEYYHMQHVGKSKFGVADGVTVHDAIELLVKKYPKKRVRKKNSSMSLRHYNKMLKTVSGTMGLPKNLL